MNITHELLDDLERECSADLRAIKRVRGMVPVEDGRPLKNTILSIIESNLEKKWRLEDIMSRLPEGTRRGNVSSALIRLFERGKIRRIHKGEGRAPSVYQALGLNVAGGRA